MAPAACHARCRLCANVGICVLEAAIRLVAHGYWISVPLIERLPWETDDLTPGVINCSPSVNVSSSKKLADRASNKTIARDLEISRATAKFHVSSMFTKLGARNQTDAVTIGLKLGLLLL